MKTVCLLLLGLLVAFIGVANAWSYGNDRSDCSGFPQHNSYSVTAGDGGYKITTSSSTFLPDQRITVTISGTSGFRGFFLAVVNATTSSQVGVFPDPASYASGYYHISGCIPSNSGIIQRNNNLKTSMSFNWTAPNSNTGTLYFQATIVKNFSAFYRLTSTKLFPAPAVEIVSPQAGAVLMAGEPVPITWKTFDMHAKLTAVNISLIDVKTGRVLQTADRLPNNFSYSLPTTVDMATDVAVNITAFSLDSLFLASARSNVFILVNGSVSLTVTNPVGVKFLRLSSTLDVEWSTYGFDNRTAMVNISIYTPNQATPIRTSQVPASIGIQSYYLNTLGAQYYALSVYNQSNPSVALASAKSGTVFVTQLTPGDLPRYAVYTPGSSVPVTWTSEGYNKTGTQVRLTLINNKNEVLASSLPTENDDSHAFTIPANLVMGGVYCVIITVEAPTETGAISIASEKTAYFTIASLFISSPEANTFFKEGDPISIQYASPGLNTTSYLRVSLVNISSNAVLATVNNITNNGTFLFTPNVTMLGQYQFNISLVNISNNVVLAVNQSARFFIIDPPAINVISPTVNNVFAAGSSLSVSWKNTGYDAPLTSMRITIVNVTSNATVQTWDNLINNGSITLSTRTSWLGFYILNFTAFYTSNNTIAASNKSPFFYLSGPALEITSPRAGMYPVGTQFTVQWSSLGINTTATYIRLSLVNATSKAAVLTLDRLPNNGSYTVPRQMMTGKFYFGITALNISNNGQVLSNTSDAFDWAHYIFTSPSLGQVLIKNQTYPILWNTTLASTTNVRLALVKNSTQVVTAIVATTPNDRKHSFTVPAAAPTAGDYYIWATSIENTTNRGQSYFFNVTSGTFVISYPPTNSTISTSSIITLQWKTVGVTEVSNSAVTIQLCRAKQDTCENLGTGIPNRGSWGTYFSSAVASCSRCTIKIISAFDPTSVGTSGAFAIYNPGIPEP